MAAENLIIDLRRLLIFHIGTKVGAEMQIDAQIMAKNRNSRSRCGRPLSWNFYITILGPPRSIFVKFYANTIHSFADM